MPKSAREFYDDEDPWDLDARDEQLELPLQYSSNSAPPTVQTRISTQRAAPNPYRPPRIAETKQPDLAALMGEMFQQIMDRLDSLEDTILQDRD